MTLPRDPADIVRRPAVPHEPSRPLPVRLLRWVCSWSWPYYALLAVLLVVFIAAGLSPSWTGSPDIQVDLSVKGEVPITLSPTSFALPKLQKNVPVSQTIRLTNTSASDAAIALVPLSAPPPGVSITYDLVAGTTLRVAAGSTVSLTMTFVSANVDSGTFTYRVLVSASLVSNVARQKRRAQLAGPALTCRA